jgi:hypothetical protein
MDIAEINETPDDFPLTKDEKLRYLHHISSLIVDISNVPVIKIILDVEKCAFFTTTGTNIQFIKSILECRK